MLITPLNLITKLAHPSIALPKDLCTGRIQSSHRFVFSGSFAIISQETLRNEIFSNRDAFMIFCDNSFIGYIKKKKRIAFVGFSM